MISLLYNQSTDCVANLLYEGSYSLCVTDDNLPQELMMCLRTSSVGTLIFSCVTSSFCSRNPNVWFEYIRAVMRRDTVMYTYMSCHKRLHMLFVQFTHTLMCIIIWLHTCDCKTSEYFIVVLDGYGTACIHWNTCLEQKNT